MSKRGKSKKGQAASGRRRLPSVDAFRLLVLLDEKKGVTQVAQSLGKSQPTVSNKLAVFLDAAALGGNVLKRDAKHNRLTLTEVGRAILPAARRLVDSYDQILEYLQGRVPAPQVLTIGAGGFAAQHFLPCALTQIRATLAKNREDWAVVVNVARGKERILGTAEGRLDLAVVSHEPFQIEDTLAKAGLDRASIEKEPLAKHRMCVVASKASEEGRDLASIPASRAVAVDRLCNWELVGLDEHSGVRRRLEQRADYLSFTLEGGGWLAAKEYARHGLGVAIAPFASIIRDDRKDLVIRRLSDDFPLSTNLICRTENNGKAIRIARQILKQVAKANQTSLEARWKTWFG